jgi:hypothetical protein
MKYIVTILLSALISTVVYSQAGVCGQFHKKYCVSEKSDKNSTWQYNAQSRSGLFLQGMVSKLRCVIYKGMDYRMSVCCETVLGDKVSYKIYDSRTSELLFDNSTSDDTQKFEFQSVSTRQLIIEVVVPQGATENEKHKSADAACIGLLIEHRVSAKQGFSQY